VGRSRDQASYDRLPDGADVVGYRDVRLCLRAVCGAENYIALSVATVTRWKCSNVRGLASSELQHIVIATNVHGAMLRNPKWTAEPQSLLTAFVDLLHAQALKSSLRFDHIQRLFNL